MAAAESSGAALGALIIGTVSAVTASIVDSEWLRVLFSAYVGALGGVMYMHHETRLQKLLDFFRWGFVGLIISAPTCYFLTAMTGAPFQTWPGFVACFGTWFLVWFLNEFKDDAKSWAKIIALAVVKRAEKTISEANK